MSAGVPTVEATKTASVRTETVAAEATTPFAAANTARAAQTSSRSYTSGNIPKACTGSNIEKKTHPSLIRHRQEQQKACYGLSADDEEVTSSDVRQDLKTARDTPRHVARSLLAVVSREACTQHLDRLVRAVTLSGNRELRSNVAVGLIMLSVESGGGHGRQVRL